MSKTFRDIIEAWPSPEALAADIGAKVEAVRKWRQRDSIPAEWWAPVMGSATKRGIALTLDELAGISARKLPASGARA